MWLVTVLSLIGVVLNIYKRAECFAVWSVTNVAWMLYDIRIGAYPQAAMFFVYFVLSVWGLIRWRKAVAGRRAEITDRRI